MSQGKPDEDLYRAVHKKGAHLASSNDTDGAYRGNLLNDKTNKFDGNAEWVKVDESEYKNDYSYNYQENQQQEELSPEAKELAQFFADIIASGTMLFLDEYVAPRVKHWWEDKAMPILKEKWSSITKKEKPKQTKKVSKQSKVQTTEIDVISGSVPGMFCQELGKAYDKYVYDMTSEEAQIELLDIFILSVMLTAKIRKLSHSRIIQDGDTSSEYIEGQEIIERLSTPEYVASINKILENNPSLLEEKAATLSKILGRSLVLNGEYVPIENDKFKEKLMMEVKIHNDK